MKNYIFVILSLSFLSTPVFSDEFKIGFIAAFSGPAKAYGDMAKNGFEMGREEFGKSGISVIYEDDQFIPVKTVTAFKKLVNQDKVDLLISCGSSPSLAISPLAESKKVPLIAWASSRDVTKNKSMVIRSWASGFQEGEALARKFKEKGLKRAATLVSADDYSIAVVNGFKETSNAKLIDLGEVAVNNNDFKTQIIKAKNSKAEAIAFCLSPGQISSFALQLKRFKYSPLLLSCETVSSKAEIDAAKGTLTGTFYPAIPVIKDFEKRYLSSFPEGAFIGGAAIHYELYKIISELKQKGTSKEQIVNELLKIKDRNTTLGKIGIFRESGDQWIKLPHVLRQVG